MLSPEQAHERLKAFQNPRYQQDQLKRIWSLWGNLPTIGEVLLQAGPLWNGVVNNHELSSKLQSKVFNQLRELKPKSRQKLFNALFPKLSPYVEYTWNLFDILPFQATYNRRPFRKPDHSSTLARTIWLQRLLLATRGYDQDILWFAAWAPYLGYGVADTLGYLFAGAIEAGGQVGQEVFDILVASASGNHEIGIMGRHVVRGLLCASRQDGWEFIERLLLAAQREEGLRQVILESVDEAHPQSFRRLLRLILDQNLSRFSSAVRAFDVWFGLALETVPQKTVNDLLSRVLSYLDDPAVREQAIQEGSAQEAYYALWAMAFDDAPAALQPAIALRQSSDVERRFVATHILAQMDLVGSFNELLNALEDPDLRIAARAVVNLNPPEFNREIIVQSDLFERLEDLIARLPHKENTFKPLVWNWLTLKLDRGMLAGMLVESLGNRSPKRLIPYLSMMEPMGRAGVAWLLEKLGKKDRATRQMLLTLAGDPSSSVRESSLKAIRGFKLTEEETVQVEGLLTRQAQDLRRGAIQILLELSDKTLTQSIKRLLGQKNENQRRAGLELLRECKKSRRCETECLRLAVEFRRAGEPTMDEVLILEDVLGEDLEQYSLNNALGLMNPYNRTRSTRPPSGKSRNVKLGSPAAVACLKSLDKLVEAHRTEPIEIFQFNTPKTELLGNTYWGFPKPDPALLPDQDFERLPLRDVWQSWWATRPEELHDEDGLELIRALAISYLFHSQWGGHVQFTAIPFKEYRKSFNVKLDFALSYQLIIQTLLGWLIRLHLHEGETNFLLDAVEASVSRIPIALLTGKNEYYPYGQRAIPYERLCYLWIARWHRKLRPETWNCEHHRRLWLVARWIDEPKAGLPRYFPELEDALLAYQCGAATRDDLLDLLLGPRELSTYGGNYYQLREVSGRRPHTLTLQFPILKELVETCRDRILSIEIRRGDMPTVATIPATNLRSIPGQENLFRLLVALGNTEFARGYFFGQSRTAVLSHLIRNSYPLEEDTQEDFLARVRQLKVSERRLIELAVYAPQWATFIESTLGWPGLGEAVWWIYAHTKDRQWSVDQEIRGEWVSRVGDHTPLSADSLMDGAVDVAWFHRVFSALGEQRWNEMYKAALYAARGNGHTRARLFADAMLGKTSTAALIDRIVKKRHQDSVRALGLVPLPEGERRQTEVFRRYEVMQEFLRTGKKFGSQRQASDKLAVAIGLENLARTAGYVDPQRLEWAMESEAVADLAIGPVKVVAGETCVSLSINYLGEPELSIIRSGKTLKSIPAMIKKEEQIASLLERKRKLERQISRMRQSLEQSMCRGDTFTGGEIHDLFQHPILRVMLEQLVFTGESGMGYPVEGGRDLATHSGDHIPISLGDKMRIAHPKDLLESCEWHLWQRECFISERIQPFKQVFRELYPLTDVERQEKNCSHRYAGQQVNSRQALALFGTRGWVVGAEEGVRKTFHELGIVARVEFAQGVFTPAEVEGLTIEAVSFTRRSEWLPLPLDQIEPRIFSEVMRDLDLVVSVAHAGGVDPEASASSIGAREALVRETCGLLDLQNVQVVDRHAIVEGKLGNYTIHLGSAVVHKQPGGSLCIIPVHSQHRGRLFLPFVDNDPKSAEVISKVILLAKDGDIKDPTILEQIIK